jgi:dUTP pyrophosphatase
MPVLPLKVARVTDRVPLPTYQSEGAGGLDLYAAVDAEIWAGCTKLVRTGFKVEIPRGYAGLVTPRSGLAFKEGITVLNAPGLIDSDYRGEIGVLLHNTRNLGTYDVRQGDRIAQLVVVPLPKVELFIVDGEELSSTERGERGFGSTGTRDEAPAA